MQAYGGSLASETDPAKFFSTVAGRLLSSELNVDLNRIQLWPTNEYTAPVHRLLQLSANVFDSTSNSPASRPPYLPSVFRPIYTNDSGAIYICGFEAVNDAQFLEKPRRSLDKAEDRAALAADDVVDGVPLVIAARKGLPNFNQFVSETSLQATRKLEFRRTQMSSYQPISETNEMHVFSLTNSMGVELWNPYSAPFERAARLHLTATIQTMMTNSSGGIVLSNVQNFCVERTIPAGAWAGFTNSYDCGPSFIVPLITNTVLLPPSKYSPELRQFVPVTGIFDRINAFPVPDLWLQQRVTANYALADIESNRLLDYVSLRQDGFSYNVIGCLMSYPDGATCGYPYLPSGDSRAQWCTNRYGGRSVVSPTFGILNQIYVSQGKVASPEFDASSNGVAVNFFRAQFGLSPLYSRDIFPRTNVFYAPYSPIRTLTFAACFETKDPLVHYTTTGLARSGFRAVFDSPQYSRINNLGYQNISSLSWPVQAGAFSDRFGYVSDDWSFPTNQHLSLSWLGRVHRGTPWQTVYWKNSAPDFRAWCEWVSPGDSTTAMLVYPTNDWRLFDELAPLFDDGYPANAYSPNDRSVEDWRALLDGILVVSAAGTTRISAASPEAELIASAIVENQKKQSWGRFTSAGDLISIRELTSSSPFLSGVGDLTEEAVEAIPAGLIPRLRADALVYLYPYDRSVLGSGLEGHNYVIEVSGDLCSWVPLSTNRVSHGSYHFWPPRALGNRFYRSFQAD